jgi:hypothetical protein
MCSTVQQYTLKQHSKCLYDLVCMDSGTLLNVSMIVDILNRHNTLSVESQLQGKRLRWLGHVFRMPNDGLRKKLLFGEVKVNLVALGLVSIMLRGMIVKLVDRTALSNPETSITIQKCHSYTRNLNLEMSGDSKNAFLHEMCKTDCFGKTRLVPHVPSSS